MSMRRVVIAVLVAACQSKAAAPPPPPSNAAPAPPPAPAGYVDVFVDDQLVTHVAPQQIQTWPRLDTLVPVAARRLGTWNEVFITGSGPKPSNLHRPSDQHPDLVPALFPGTTGPSFGMFDPVELAKHGAAQIREDGVTQIRIKLAQNSGRGEHEQGQGGGADPTELTIAIKTPKGESKLEGKQLLQIPRIPLPGETGEGRGWSLQTLLDAAGIKKFDKLLLTDAQGLNLTLEKADFDPAKSIPYVKLNRQGNLRFNLFKKQGEGWARSGDLRGLVGIEVIK